MNGMRQQKQPSAKQRMQKLAKEVENLNMATRIIQLSMQQLLNNYKNIDKDVGNAMGLLNDLQYRTLAMLELGDFDKKELDKKADEIKLKDYNEASDKEDLKKGYTKVDTVTEDSVVIITSTTTGTDKGIFRSKFQLKEANNKEFVNKLVGKQVGAKVTTEINGLKHEIELLGIRDVPKSVEPKVAVSTPVVGT